MSHKDSTSVAALSNSDQIKSRIADLLEALQKNLPNYESLLHTIHRNLALDPETVQLLSEEEIGIIVSALSKKTGMVIAKAEAEKITKGKSKPKLEDLM